MIPSPETPTILGLRPDDLASIYAIISTFPEIEQALVYGSRGRGSARHTSDIDIAIKGASADVRTAWNLKSRLDEDLPLPYMFDVVHYDSLKNSALRANIDRDGKLIYAA